MSSPSSYKDAGVDRDQEEETVKSILQLIQSTHIDNTIPEGHYAGSIPFGDHLISMANDGVGSKVILAQQLGDLTTIGIDCVAMCVNDLISIGSIPSAFVDYIAIRNPDKSVVRDIVKGLVDGCKQAEIPLVGGETASLPEVLTEIANNNGFDVAGTALGIHHKDKTITGDKIAVGDKIIAIRSNGIHSNGLTLARKLVDEAHQMELLKPTRIYVRAIKSLLDEVEVHGMAHITGGGLTNLFRLGSFHYDLNKLDMIDKHPIFDFLQTNGKIETKEMYRTFNMGIGYIVIVPKSKVDSSLRILNDFYPSFIIGEIKKGNKITFEFEKDTITFHE